MDRKAMGAVAAALAIGASGCGGAARLSKAEFVKRAEVICKQRTAHVTAAESRARGRLRAAMTEVASILGRGDDELNKLEPPKEFEAKFKQVMLQERRQLERLRRGLAGKRAGKEENVDEYHRQARYKLAIGLRDCV